MPYRAPAGPIQAWFDPRLVLISDALRFNEIREVNRLGVEAVIDKARHFLAEPANLPFDFMPPGFLFANFGYVERSLNVRQIANPAAIESRL